MVECDHEFEDEVVFDLDAARNLSSEEVRKRWPRKFSRCKHCSLMVMRYASPEHFVYGDW